ncbi:unnamed protein product [Penicillium salamii]|uniref:Major facilitator superfamily (MFS) profile domain-containing protein n=1 Tax=Penicillium salamii TaxID=1612424 RepID=A0A9W4NES0_9EURO|nr:unnamed protein product [Penicillium salamii]CAG8033838.1 unnamed protein product [Penicillium salamii]CAG8057732.1 unnamed protein product [Penicillium salamii]CAG8264591.1 unnamed protein product [Penicillium salamii]CAG8336192.1 unnamed protein product [Penicillium salamii]
MPAWIAQLFAVPAFTSRFGYEYKGQYVISAKWQSALAAVSIAGLFIGAPIVAVLMDRYGRRPTLLLCLVLSAAFTFIQFFSTTLPVLLVGTLLMGCVLGCFGVLSLTYAMEVAPLHLRGVLGGLYSVGIITGPVLATALAQGAVNMSSVWAYRMGFAIQWVWPLFLFPASFFVPESPVWLTRQGRAADAEAALRRLAVPGLDVLPDLERMVELDRQEQSFEASSSYTDIFKGTNLRRTMISTISYASIATTGNNLANNTAYFMLLAGVDADTGLYWSLGCTLAAFVASFAGLYILARCRRRRIYIWAQLISSLCLLLIGFLQLEPGYYQSRKAVSAQGGFMVVWNLTYGAVIGPLSTVIMAEVSSNALRAKTVAFASMVQSVVVVLGMTIHPYFLAPESAHLQGFVGFIAGGSGILWTLWAFFLLPETSLSIEKLDDLFHRQVSTRRFTG